MEKKFDYVSVHLKEGDPNGPSMVVRDWHDGHKPDIHMRHLLRFDADFAATALNFFDGFEPEHLKATHKGLSFYQCLEVLALRAGVPMDKNPLVTLEGILIQWDKHKSSDEFDDDDDDDDDDEYETDSDLDDDEHSIRIDAIWTEFNSHFDEIDDEEGAYLNEVISPALDAIDEDTAKEIWALWFKNTENAEQRGIMLPAIIQRLGVKDFDDWIADDNG